MTTKTDIIYRIRQKSTGLYSKGGANPEWSQTGKCYAGTSILKQHLTEITTVICNQMRQGKELANPYKDCEVICYTENGSLANHMIEQIDVDVFAFKMRKK